MTLIISCCYGSFKYQKVVLQRNCVCVRLSEEGGEEEELVDHAYEAFCRNRSGCSKI